MRAMIRSSLLALTALAAAGSGISASPAIRHTAPICIVRISPKRSLNHPTSVARISTPTIPKIGKK